MRKAMEKAIYLTSGLTQRAGSRRRCPGCSANETTLVDKKWFHQLLECRVCSLLYRWPYEKSSKMSAFYQNSYSEPGLTTELPDDLELESLVQKNFQGTSKEFTRYIRLLNALSLPVGSRVLDFGANWGYGVLQFCIAGYDAVGYELSAPRAHFGKKLGVSIFSSWDEVIKSAPYDLVFSSHVLEHTPSPTAALEQIESVLRPGGAVVSVVPNGSSQFRDRDFEKFHKLWGQVHPVVLNERFYSNFYNANYSHAVLSFGEDDFERLSNWDQTKNWSGSLDDWELVSVAVSKA